MSWTYGELAKMKVIVQTLAWRGVHTDSRRRILSKAFPHKTVAEIQDMWDRLYMKYV